MSIKRRILQVHPNDNVLVALQDLAKGETLEFNGQSYTLLEDVPAKHKFTTQFVPEGADIIMYGVLVGKAKTNLAIGVRIATENIRHASDGYQLGERRTAWQIPSIENGRTRHLWVITVKTDP